MLATAFRCADCGSETSRTNERGAVLCAECFPQTQSREQDDLAADCAQCGATVARYDASGRAWCDRCYTSFTDTRKPLPGVVCPNCHRNIGVTQAIDGVWCCAACRQAYAWACYRIGREPIFPDPNKSPKSSTYPQQKEEPMPKKTQQPAPILTLSHSQIEQWEKCQLAWRFHKIDRIQAAPSEALILGTAFHAALEEDGQMKHDGALEDYQLLATFEQVFQAELAKVDPTGLISKEKRIALRRKAQLMITEYIKTVQPHYNPLEVEKDFTFHLSDQVAFTGRIDAVTASSIVDWKTASKPWTPGDQHHKDQATAYLIARPDQTRVSFAVFAPNGESCSFQSLATERTEAQKAQYQQKVLKVADEIRAAKASGEFPANPGPLCGWCGYLGSCSAGEAWLKLHGRVPQVPVVRTTQEQTTGIEG